MLDLVLSEDSFPPVVPQIMLTTKFLVYNCVARELFVSNSSIQCHAETGNGNELRSGFHFLARVQGREGTHADQGHSTF